MTLNNNGEGRWITVRGTRVFISDGESIDDAIRKKFSVSDNNKIQAPDISSKDFYDRFHAAKNSLPPQLSWRVDGTYSAEDYNECVRLAVGNKSTVAVHNGDIISVCRADGDTARGKDLLKAAVDAGGDRLDAFSGLFGFYAKCGFEPVSWTPFDENYAPADWVKGRDDPEPVIFWKYTGRPSPYLNVNAFLSAVSASADYDSARELRDKSIRDNK